MLSEACLTLGPVLTAPYATPTTADLAAALRPFVHRADALLMDRHGSITVGSSLDQAYDRLETLEHTAQIIWAARQLGPITALGPEDQRRLGELAAALGLRSPMAPRGRG